jgi:pyruvate/2-oxoglutarate dehydrogenase complex dihydrolipoamide dehydrogenase (E3) component
MRAVVIGAGPGGMAAALLLDQSGVDTELIEERSMLGGGLVASAAPPHKDKLDWYRQYLCRQLAASGVKITTGERADAGSIAARHPDLVLLAHGRFTHLFPIAGGDAPIVHNAYELLMGDDGWLGSLGDGPVLVYGGGETGCETAEYLTHRGREVILASRSPIAMLARSAEPIYRKVLRRRLAVDPQLTILPETSLDAIEGDEAVLRDADGRSRSLRVAAVIIAQGRVADTALADALAARGIVARPIGDARIGGRIGDAVRDAYEAVVDMIGPMRIDRAPDFRHHGSLADHIVPGRPGRKIADQRRDS